MKSMHFVVLLLQVALTVATSSGCTAGDDDASLLQAKTKLDDANPSFLGTRSKLAAMPATKLLGEVEMMVQEVAKSDDSGNASAPPVRDLSKVKTIKNIVQDILMPGLTDAHAFAEKQLTENKEKIDVCIKTASDNLAVVAQMNTSTSKAEADHATCRHEEEELAKDMKTKCDDLKIFLDGLSSQLLAQPEEMSLHLVWPYLKEQHRLFLILEEKNHSCNTSTEAHTAKKESCDEMQSTFESDFCQYRTKIYDTTEAFTTCNATSFETYGSAYTATQAEVPKWKSEYKAIKKIECFLSVWLSDDNLSTVNTTSPSFCKASDIDVSPLNVSYPDIPEDEAFQTMTEINASIHIVNPYPGMGTFLDRYDDLPTHKDAVSACLTYTTTTTTIMAPYDKCIADANVAGQGAATRTDFRRGCDFMRDGIPADACLKTCAAHYGNSVSCCECSGRCHTCPCAYCTKYCKEYQPTTTTTTMAPYDKCIADANVAGQGAATRTDFRRGCNFMRDGVPADACLKTCAAHYGNSVSCCECSGRCHTCPCAYCTKYCEEYQSAAALLELPSLREE